MRPASNVEASRLLKDEDFCCRKELAFGVACGEGKTGEEKTVAVGGEEPDDSAVAIGSISLLGC